LAEVGEVVEVAVGMGGVWEVYDEGF